MITIEQACASEYWDENSAMAEENWLEINNYPENHLNVNLELLQQIEAIGLTDFLVCKDEGEVVGYMLNIRSPRLHQKDSIYSINDVIYVSPSHRNKPVFVRLVKEMEKIAKENGATMVMISVRNNNTALERFGYKYEETVYAKVI